MLAGKAGGQYMQHDGQGRPCCFLWLIQEDLMKEMDIWISYISE